MAGARISGKITAIVSEGEALSIKKVEHWPKEVDEFILAARKKGISSRIQSDLIKKHFEPFSRCQSAVASRGLKLEGK